MTDDVYVLTVPRNLETDEQVERVVYETSTGRTLEYSDPERRRIVSRDIEQVHFTTVEVMDG
jgi:hypothetical protein